MKQFFVIGNNTSTSLSPTIFNHWFKKHNIKAKYSFIEVKDGDFKKIIDKKTKDKNTYGFNITIPFKKNITKIVDVLDVHAQRIGAVNCVTVKRKTSGSNTDWVGYINSLKKEKIDKKKTILILGFGGASQAIYYGLTIKGFKNIVVFNRSRKIINIRNIKKYTKKYPLINNYLTNAGLIINTTPTNPLNKKQINLIKEDTIISDIVYKPKNTAFMNQFKNNRKIFGISMLIEQALPCFYKWFGFVPEVDKALLKKLNNKIK